ncbi:MAG: TetM/TetW/TetO/TetS family tetracycline resistance ribosomal protection protein [Bacteroidetes bacterium]|nr:TetM/TetW/TetO/TetS family tetracycline resistance ribosomal protection protein [Bacteroidota bacterium]
MRQPIRNIAIMAHADAGKTTITEQFLFLGGQVQRAGSVDQGTAQTDFLPVERERGISVRSAHTSLEWNETLVNLIDTPGHVDFSADVERILRIPDGVVLVISAVEGVQAHTETLWAALRERHIPVIFFLNKLDRVGADSENVIHSIERELKIRPLCLQKVEEEGENGVSITGLWSAGYMAEKIIEQIVSTDEDLLNNYLEGASHAFDVLDHRMTQLIQSCDVYPLLLGSAKLGLGIEELLNAVINYIPASLTDAESPLSALVYGIGHDKLMGKIAHVRLYHGRIKNRDVIFNSTRQIAEKVTQVRRIFPGRHVDIGMVEAGDIAGISGLSGAKVGDLLGFAHDDIPKEYKMRPPLLTVQIKAVQKKDYSALADALMELDSEDPSLDFEWLREEAEMHVKIMGWIQMEVLERILSDRFGIAARFENPTVIYKETPAKAGEGFVQYWMPKPCWAIMKFRIEPGERGSGVVYQSFISVNDVQQKYQNEVERSISGALKQGIKGWEVTDIRISLIEGEDHPMHSRAGDFAIATPMGIMNGLVNTGTTLLEPMIRFQINATEDLLGAISSDITRMRGSFSSPAIDNSRFILTGIVPLATSLDYPVKLSSRSGGKARVSMHFDGFRECLDELGVIRPFKGISPLDTAKYILKARRAIQ